MTAEVTRLVRKHAFSMAVLVVLVVALVYPRAFLSWFGVNLFAFVGPSIQLIMFGMGATLTLADFAGVARQPWKVALGAVLQFTIMPFSGVAVARILGLDGELAAGMILIGSVAGGMASNVIAYLAMANVALSVSMTCVSTLVSPFATPFLMKMLAGTYVEIDAVRMMVEMLKVVLVPVAAGFAVRLVFSSQFEAHKTATRRILSSISMFAICFNLGVITAPNHDGIVAAGVLVILAGMMHIGVGYLLGYWVSRLIGAFLPLDECDARTIAIEVGMQNAGLASALAVTVLGSTIAALPANAAAIVGSTSGSLLANYWGQRPPKRAACQKREDEIK